MNTLIDTLSLSMIIISVGILATAVLLPLYVFKSTQNLQDASWQEQDWKFSDWAGNLTPMGTIIGLVIPFIQKNPTITGLSLIFTAIVILLPFSYTSIWCARRSPAWCFLLWSMLVQFAVVAQLLITANLADDGIIATVPALALHIFRWCLIAGACFILYYTWQSTRNLVVLKQNTSEQKNKRTAVASGSPTRQLA